jgi:toxin secretion/phage lysis holin
VDGNDKIIAAVFILYLVDLVTGTLKAMKRRELQSGKFFTGATKLLVYGIFLLIAGSIDQAIGAGNVARWVMFVFIITTDGLSILENLEALGVNTPIFLKKYLHAAQAKAE